MHQTNTKDTLLILTFIILSISPKAQEISFSFSTNYMCSYSESDSIMIENLSQGGDTVLYWNDTVLSFLTTEISSIEYLEKDFFVSQNYPNPFDYKTSFKVYAPANDEFVITVYDNSGKILTKQNYNLQKGLHNFSFTAGNANSYILQIRSAYAYQNIVMVQVDVSNASSPSIHYNGISAESELKTKQTRAYFSYSIGDQLRFTAFVNGENDTITDTPFDNTNYTFNIADEEPEPPSQIIGPNLVSESETDVIYSVPAEDGISYQWTLPSDWEIIQGQGLEMIMVNVGSESGNVSVKAINNCGQSEAEIIEVTVCPDLNIGDEYGGGIVVYTNYPISENCECGYMISSLNDQSDGITWNNGTNILVYNATFEPIGNGMSNTNAIIEMQGPVETDYAAGLARAYNGGGYHDWFLPSKDELNILYINKEIVGGFSDAIYWSSTDCGGCGANTADCQDFSSGAALKRNKFDTYRVRAVRVF